MQQASYLEGGPLVWMLPLYLHVNQKSDYDDMNDNGQTTSRFLLSFSNPDKKKGWVCDREVAGSIPGRVIPKTLKMVLAALLLGAQH